MALVRAANALAAKGLWLVTGAGGCWCSDPVSSQQLFALGFMLSAFLTRFVTYKFLLC